MRVAVEGCAHGDLDQIYDTIEKCAKEENGNKVDLLLCCGDFQSVRNLADLKTMARPDKYQSMGSFWKYYSGQVKAPVLTIFVGGNHEATNYLQELPYGGWVAHNIYYTGYAGVVRVMGRDGKKGIRVGGLSGIFKGHDYLKGHYESPPYDNNTMRSAYHIRNLETFRLRQMREAPPAIIISHDWPLGVYEHGDVNQLLRWKPYFREDIENNRLGSRPTQEVLEEVKPAYWFSAHLHVKFPALIEHKEKQGEDEEQQKEAGLYSRPRKTEGLLTTRFLALDKVLPRRGFLQVVNVEEEEFDDMGDKEHEPNSVHFDPAWVAVLRNTAHLSSSSSTLSHMPGPGYKSRWNFSPSEEEVKEAGALFGGDLRVREDLFSSEAVKAFDPETDSIKDLHRTQPPNEARLNKQTEWLCQKLNIKDPLEAVLEKQGRSFQAPEASIVLRNEDEIDLDGESSDDGNNDNATAVPMEPPKRMSLVLPAPKVQEEMMEAEKEVSTNFVVDAAPSSEATTSETASSEAATSEEALPVKKQLKRRNQALYTEEDNE